MTSTESSGTQPGGGGGLLGTLKNSPAVAQLSEAARGYARARGSDAVHKLGDRLGGVTENLQKSADGGGFKAAAAGDAVKRVVQGQSPFKAAMGGIGAGIKEKVKGLFGKGGGGKQKIINIVEDIHVGVPVDVAYNQWTQFQEFSSFMKGVDSVDQTDEVESNWRVKVFKSRRNWKASITEQIPDRKIAWTTDGAKGTTKGVVTFHPLADDLTQVLLVIEYYPQGLFEKTGNIWRAQGRRARLDLKHFRRFLMMRGEETGSWRGEIRDGEVVRGPDEEETEGAEERTEEEAAAEEEPAAEYEEEEEEEEPEEEEPAAEYEEEEEEEEEEPEEEEPEEERAEEPPAEGRRRRREPAGAR